MIKTAKEFDELLLGAQRRVLHLESRDLYASRAFEAWIARQPYDRGPADSQWRDLVTPVVSRGVRVRRLRVISEPVSPYIRFEHEVTPAANLAAGEHVRWLSRRRASDLAFPGNDYWLFDDHVLFNHFSGDGDLLEVEVVDEASVVKFCASAFEAAWDRAVDHAHYQPS